jgi:hypothetical protein
MTGGGIIQLETYGIEDKPLIANPEITYFKQQYRQHSLFSSQEIENKFKGKPGFGSVAESNIVNGGDLLQDLTLCVDLPSVSTYYPNTVQEEISQNIKSSNFDLSPAHYMYFSERLREFQGNDTYSIPLDDNLFVKTYPWLNSDSTLLESTPQFQNWTETLWSVPDVSANDELTRHIASFNYQNTQVLNSEEALRRYYNPLNAQYFLHVLQKSTVKDTITNSNQLYSKFITRIKDYIIRSKEFQLVKYIEENRSINPKFSDIQYSKNVLVNIGLQLNTRMELEPLLYCYSKAINNDNTITYQLKCILNKKTSEFANNGYTINTEVFSNNYDILKDNFNNEAFFIGTKKDIINSLDLQQIANIRYVSSRTVRGISSETLVYWDILYTNDPNRAVEWEIDIADPLRDVYPSWDVSYNYNIDFNITDNYLGLSSTSIENKINKYLVYVYASSKPEDQDIITKDGLYATDENQKKYVVDASNNYFQVKSFITQPTVNPLVRKYVPIIFNDNNSYNVNYNNKYYLDTQGNVQPLVLINNQYFLDTSFNISINVTSYDIAFVIDLYKTNTQNMSIDDVLDLSNNYVPVINLYNNAKYIYRGRYYNYLNMYYKDNNTPSNLRYPLDGFPYLSPVCVFYIQNIIGNKLYLRKFTQQDATTDDVILINNDIEIVNMTTKNVNYKIIGNSIFEASEISGYDVSSNLYTLNTKNVSRNATQFYWDGNYNLIDPNNITQYITKEYWSDDSIPYMFTLAPENLINYKMLPMTNVELLQVNYDVYNNYNHLLNQLNQSEISDENKFNQLVTQSGNVSKYNLEYLKRIILSFLKTDTFLSQYVKTDRTSSIILQPFFITEHYNHFISTILDVSTNETNLIHTIITNNLRQFTDTLDLNFINTIKQISYDDTVLDILSQEYVFGFEVTTTVQLPSIIDVSCFSGSQHDTSFNNLSVINTSSNKYILCLSKTSDFNLFLDKFITNPIQFPVLKVDNTYVDTWSIVYGQPVARSTANLIEHPMYSNYILNNVFIDFYLGLVKKIINKFTPAIDLLDKFFKTHLIEHLWHLIQSTRQMSDQGFSLFAPSNTVPNIYAFNNVGLMFDAKNIANMLTNVIDKYFQQHIRPQCIDFLNGKTINNRRFYFIEADMSYRPNNNDIELSNLSNLELLQWVVYEKHQDDTIFSNLIFSFVNYQDFGDASGNINNNISLFLRTLLTILDGETSSGNTLLYNVSANSSNVVFGSTILLETANVNDIMINYINETIGNYINGYKYNYILQYFDSFKSEYIKFYDTIFKEIYNIGLSSYETINNIQKITNFELSDYVKQFNYPRINPTYNPNLDFITYENLSTTNPNNYYYYFELNFRNKINTYFNYFINKSQQDINLYFSYRNVLNLQNYSESDIITKWNKDFYFSKTLSSSFEFKCALEWFIFNRVQFGSIGSFFEENSIIRFIIGETINSIDSINFIVPLCIRTPRNTMRATIQDGYFYDIDASLNLYPRYDISNNRYMVLANNRLTVSPMGVYDRDFSDNSVVDVSGNTYFHLKDVFYNVSNTVYTMDPSGNFRDVSNNVFLQSTSTGFYQEADISSNKYIRINNLFYDQIDYVNGIVNPLYAFQINSLYKILFPSFEKIRNYYFYSEEIYEMSHRVVMINNNQFRDASNNLYTITLNAVIDASNNRIFTIDNNALLNKNNEITYVISLDKSFLYRILTKIELPATEIMYRQAVINPVSRQIEYHFDSIPDEQWVNTIPGNWPRRTFAPLAVDPSFNLDEQLTFVKDIIHDIFNDTTLYTVAKLNWNLNDVMQNVEYQIPILINLLIRNSLLPPQQSWEQYMMVSMWNNAIKIYHLNASHFINQHPKALEIQESVTHYNSRVGSELRVLYWNVSKQKFGSETFAATDEVQLVPYIYDYYHSGDISTNALPELLNTMNFNMVQHIEHLASVYSDISSNTTLFQQLQQQTDDLKTIKRNFMNVLYNNLPKELVKNTTEVVKDLSQNRTYSYDNVWIAYDEFLEYKNGIPVYITDLPFGFEYDFSDNKIRYTATFDETKMIIHMLYYKWNKYLETKYMPDVVNRNLTSLPVLPDTSNNYINQRTLRFSEDFDDLQKDFLAFIDLNLLEREAYYGIRQYMKTGEGSYLYAMIIDNQDVIQRNDYIIVRKNNYPFGPLFIDFAYKVDISGTGISGETISGTDDIGCNLKILKILKDPIFIFDKMANYSIEGPLKRQDVIKVPSQKTLTDISINAVFKNLFNYYHDFSGNKLSDPLYLLITMLGVQPLIDFVNGLQSLPFLQATSSIFNALSKDQALLEVILTQDASENYYVLENLFRFTNVITTFDASNNLLNAIKDEVFQKLIFFIIAIEISKSNIFSSIDLNTILPQLFPNIVSLGNVFANNPNWINYILDPSHNFINLANFIADPSLNIISIMLDPSNNLLNIPSIISSYGQIISFVLSNSYININTLLSDYPQLVTTFIKNNFINIQYILTTYPQLINRFLMNGYIDLQNILTTYPLLTNYITQNISSQILTFISTQPAFANSLVTNGILYTNYPTVSSTLSGDLSNNSNIIYDPSWNGIYTAINNLAPYGLSDISLNALLYYIDPSQTTFPYTAFLIGYLFYNGLIQYNTQQVLYELQIQGLFDDLINTLNTSTIITMLFTALQSNVDPSFNSVLQLLDPSINFVNVLTTIQTDPSINSVLQLLDPSINFVDVLTTIQTDPSINSVFQLLDPSINVIEMVTDIIQAIGNGTITNPSSVLSLLPPGVTPLILFNSLQQRPDISMNLLFSTVFENIDLLGLFGEVSQDAAINPQLVDDLSLNSLFTLLDPSGSLLERVVTNTYLIQYLFQNKFINVLNFVPQFTSALLTNEDLLDKIIPYINFSELQGKTTDPSGNIVNAIDSSGNKFLLASFDVNIFVSQYFQPLLKYLPSIISQVEPQDLFIYTDEDAVTKYISDHPEIITTLIQPSTILNAVQSSDISLNSLINIEKLIQNFRYNPDLLPIFTNIETLFNYIISDESNQLVFRLFNNQQFAIFIDQDPTFFTNLLDTDRLKFDLSGNSYFNYLFDNSGNDTQELAALTEQFPLLLLFLSKYLDPAKIAELLVEEPDTFFKFVNITELLILVQDGVIPFDELIDVQRLISYLETDNNLVGLLLDINTIRLAIETDPSNNILKTLLDKAVLKTFIQSIPIDDIQKIVKTSAFTDPSNNKWLNYFDMEEVTSDPAIRAILPSIVRPGIFTNQIQVFQGVNNVEFLLDPSKNYIDVLGLLTEEDVVRVLLDTSGNNFQILQILFGALDKVITDISGNINLLYSFISLFDDKSLFGLLANRELLNTINENILKGIFKALPLSTIINARKNDFSQILLSDISGNTNNLISISTILDEQTTLEAFRTNQPADILGDFINLITLDTIGYAIGIQVNDPSSNFIESFFISSLGEGNIGKNFAASIFQQFGTNIAFILQFIDFPGLLSQYLTVFFNYINLTDSSGNVNSSISKLINLPALLSQPQLFLADLSENTLDLVLNSFITLADPNYILNNPDISSNTYFLSILYIYKETVNGVEIPGILDISDASVFVDPSFNWLPYIKKGKLLNDISNNPQILLYFIDFEKISPDVFLTTMFSIIPFNKIYQILSDTSLNVINYNSFSNIDPSDNLINLDKLRTDISNNVFLPLINKYLLEVIFSNFDLGRFLVTVYENYRPYLTNAIKTININDLRLDLSNNRTSIISDISEGRISLSNFASLITTSGLQALVSNDPQKILQYFDLVDIDELVLLIQNDPRLFLDLLTDDIQLSDIVDFSNLSINTLLQDSSLISGLLNDTTTDPSNNLLSSIISNQVMIDILFKNNPIRDESLNVIDEVVIDKAFLKTLSFLPDQLKDISNNLQLKNNITTFTDNLNGNYTIIPKNLEEFSQQDIFKPLFLGFTQAFLNTPTNQNIFLFTENRDELEILQYITIKDTNTNQVYGPYPIITAEVINDQKLLKIHIDPSFNSVYDSSTNFIINNYYNSSLAVKNINNYQWRDYYKQSYEIISLDESIIPVIQTLITQFQSNKTLIPDRNKIANDLIIISTNTDVLKARINDVSGVSISNVAITNLLTNAQSKLSYFSILFNSYLNLDKIYDNRTFIYDVISKNQTMNTLTMLIDASLNEVKNNINTGSASKIGLNKVIEYGNDTNDFVNYSRVFIEMIDLINNSKTDIENIAGNLSGTQLSTFNSQTSIITNSGLTNPIKQQLLDLSNNPFVYIQDISNNSQAIENTDYNESMIQIQNYFNKYGNLLQLNSQSALIQNFISDLSTNMFPSVRDISNNVVFRLDNSLNILQTDKFIESLDGYIQWLDISLNQASLQSLIQEMITLERSEIRPGSGEKVKDASGNINLIAIYEKKFGIDLSFNIDLFKYPVIPYIIEYILESDTANDNLQQLINLIDIRNMGDVFADTSMNNILSQALVNTNFFFSNLPIISTYSASLPLLSTFINSRPQITSPRNATSQLHTASTFFAGFSTWIVNSLLSISTIELKNKLTTIKSIINILINPSSPLNTNLTTLLQVPAVQSSVQSLLNKFNTLKTFSITDISDNITLLDTLEVIKARNTQITSFGNNLSSIALNLLDVSSNLTLFDNNISDISNNLTTFDNNLIDPSSNLYKFYDNLLDLSTNLLSFNKIVNYNKLISRWNDIKQLYQGARNSYFAYFQAQLRRLYDIITIKENLDILDIIGNDEKVKEWLSIGVKSNSSFILASDQSDFLELNDWIMLQDNNEANSYPVIINDLQSIIYRNDKYKIVRVIWKNGAVSLDTSKYTIEGGIGNFVTTDMLHERTFFDIYSDYSKVASYSQQLLSYADVYSDYTNVYQVNDYINYILKDILAAPFDLPNSVLGKVYGHGFGSITFNPDITSLDQYNISYNKDVLIQKLQDIINRPSIPTVAWIDYLGHFLASKIELLIDDQPLQILTSDWLHIHHNINTPDGHHRGYDIMIGNTPQLTTPNIRIEGTRLYIPLPFYFQKRASLALPLIAMFNSNVHMKVHTRKLDELLHIPITAQTRIKGDFKMVLLGKYVYLSDVERKLFAESRHEYLIEQIQYRVKSVDSTQVTDEIHFQDPTKDMFFFYQSEDNIKKKQYHNYTLQPSTITYPLDILKNERLKYKYLIRDICNNFINIDISESNIIRNVGLQPTIQYDDNPFERFVLYLNGHKRFDCQGFQTGAVYPMDRYKKTFVPGLNVYPFCRLPEEAQPSGYCNFSYITDQKVEYKLKEATDGVVKVLARSYNMLRVMGGIAGIGF